MFISISEMKNSYCICCEHNNHGRFVNRYDNKIVAGSKYGVRYLVREDGKWVSSSK